MIVRRILISLVLAGGLACGGDTPSPAAENQCPPKVREVVEALGRNMKQVQLLADKSIRWKEMRAAYTTLATPSALREWIDNPAGAPGREVSSPSPERIEVTSMRMSAPGVCLVEGLVVYTASVGVASRRKVAVYVEANNGWRVSRFVQVVGEEVDSTKR